MLWKQVKLSRKMMLIALSITIIIMGWYLLPYFFTGILVKTQRNTGPELIVVNSYGRLNEKYQGLNINLNEMFTFQDLDSQNGPIKKDDYLIHGSVQSVRKFGLNNFFVYDIKGIIRKDIYYLLMTLFIGLIAIQITFVVKYLLK